MNERGEGQENALLETLESLPFEFIFNANLSNYI